MVSLRTFLNRKKFRDILSNDHQGRVLINDFFESRGNNPPRPISGDHFFLYPGLLFAGDSSVLTNQLGFVLTQVDFDNSSGTGWFRPL
jgi:hypothetical protein